MERKSGQLILLSIYCLLSLWIISTFWRRQKTDEIVFSIGAGTKELQVIENLIDTFNERHPGIPVRLNTLPAPTDQQHHYYLTTLGAETKGIDVIRIDTIWIAEFASAGWIEPLDPYIDTEERSSFIPVTGQTNVFKGNLYAIPWNANTGLLYYRKDLLDKYGISPPETWDELINASIKISPQEYMYGYLWQGKQYEGLVCNFIEFIGSNNGRIQDEHGRFVVNSEQNKTMLDLMHDLIWEYRISPPNTYSELMEESSRHLFHQGKGLFLRNWTYVWDLAQEDPSLSGLVGVSHLPKYTHEGATAVFGGWHLAINAHSQKKREAWQLIQFLTSQEVQKKLAMELSWAPTRKSLYGDPDLRRKLPFLPIVEKVLENVQIRPNLPYYQWISDIIQKYVNKVLSNQMGSRDALETIQTKLKRLEHEFSEN